MDAGTSRRHERRRGRHLRQLRRDCARTLDALRIGGADDIFALCAAVGQRRARPVRLAPVDLRATGVYGLWLATHTEDVVLYEARTSRLHQEHIVAHELAHILCDHHRDGGLEDAAVRLLFPHLDPATVRGMLGRCGYLDAEEQEAELMASLLLPRVQRRSAEAMWAPPHDAARTLARIESVIGQNPATDRS
ncbi:ImmA/IrrE family metallo-endopeptidase [Streptomyces sp. JJ66]|uniref:ImmA/IrrE family metallo-endopeptidase n=1 Tax=Streptomyces sp. JJ66 TaxID=2803843 RepID=UPI001C59B9E3|nr:ImmA/IrrE family metallo-endopeptidase [Streptomyces sp. JJ66]MBW1602017.1 ImmA/IrrE family metallo-endopeptidase [Streptomyces sp. JJ66]